MAHELAKLLLERAGTFLERTEAIRTAMRLGMPLRAIEEYLDWLDLIRSHRPDDPVEDDEGSDGTPNADGPHGG
jgi:hypothetical protein